MTKNQPLFRSAYNGYKPFQIHCTEKSMTQQNFKDECDINNILKKYQKTGLLEHVNQHKGDYTDLTESTDYHTAVNIVLNAQNSFDSLPSSLRKKFDNDPGKFVEFVANPDNIDEMQRLGLTNAPTGPIEVKLQTEPVDTSTTEKSKKDAPQDIK